MNDLSRKVTEHIEFIKYFEAMDDPRQEGKLKYPLEEILLLTLCGVLCGADGWVEISEFGQQKLSFLRRFFPFANAIPSHDQPLPEGVSQPLWNVHAILYSLNEEVF